MFRPPYRCLLDRWILRYHLRIRKSFCRKTHLPNFFLRQSVNLRLLPVYARYTFLLSAFSIVLKKGLLKVYNILYKYHNNRLSFCPNNRTFGINNELTITWTIVSNSLNWTWHQTSAAYSIERISEHNHKQNRQYVFKVVKNINIWKLGLRFKTLKNANIGI